MGKGIIELPPQEVYDSIRNPQLRFTYDSMLKVMYFITTIINNSGVTRIV